MAVTRSQYYMLQSDKTSPEMRRLILDEAEGATVLARRKKPARKYRPRRK